MYERHNIIKIKRFWVVRQKKKRCLNISQCCIDYCKFMADSTYFCSIRTLIIIIFLSFDMFLNTQMHFKSLFIVYKPHNNAKIRRFWVVRQKGLRFSTLSIGNTWHRKDSPRNNIILNKYIQYMTKLQQHIQVAGVGYRTSVPKK